MKKSRRPPPVYDVSMRYGVQQDHAIPVNRGSATWNADWSLVVLASSSGSAGLWLALHYPLWPWAISAAFAAGCLVFWRYPASWLVVVPALLPLIGFAPWTGWITFEELDLLILAVATGGYARHSVARARLDSNASSRSARVRGTGTLAASIIVLFAISVVVALVRGLSDAGGFEFGWYQGYYDAMNSVRLAKAFFLALLVWPLLSTALREAPEVNTARWSLGMTLGLIGAALAAVWERGAFTGLLDFSSDYRTTALFWEMHVGGAALDGFLALTVPFGVRELVAAKTPWRWAVGAAAVLLAGYACLTTFSRGVYLAIPVGVAVLLWLQSTQRRGPRIDDLATPRRHGLIPGAILTAAFCLSAAWLFPTSGYRGLLALFGATAILLPLVGMLRGCALSHAVLGIGIGVALSGLAALGALWFAKGAYVAYGLSAVAAAGLAFWPAPGDRHEANATRVFGLASFVSVLASVCLVCWRWGGEGGLRAAVPVVAAVLAIALLSVGSKRAMWPDNMRWHGIALSSMLVVASVVAVFGGGAYMESRFSATSHDFDGRVRHWREAFQGLRTADDWLFGKGSGRFPASRLLVGADEARPGDYRLIESEGNPYVALAGGRQETDWGDMLRFSQRIPVPVGRVTVDLDIRSERAAVLHLEVCEKHLLYGAGCQGKDVEVAARPGQWQATSTVLNGDALSGGAWYAPRLTVFALGIASQGGRFDVDNLVLKDALGRELIANGDFSHGLTRWFFTSDRSHLPWHVKNLFLHVLFEQGAVAVALLSILIAGSLWRLTAGHARGHPIAPPAAAALIGFALVGLFDSLLDVPRIAFLFYVLLLSGLAVRTPPPRASR